MRALVRRSILCAVAAALTLGGLCAGSLGSLAKADETTVSEDTLRTGWDQNEPNLSPANVTASNFGSLFSAQLDGQIYAQPLVAAGTLIVATENDEVYGLDPATGAIRWTDNVGPAWPASAIGCGDLTPNLGITSTPVYDSASNAVYFTAKVNNGPDANHPNWYMHAVDPATGAERAGFPVLIAGAPSNDPSTPFNPYTQQQRPGLLLLGGVIYAAFGSECDFGPYRGYVTGVSTSTAKMTAMWTTEAGAGASGGGIWQSGGGLISDGANRIEFSVSNTSDGISPPAGPGSTPPSTLSESVVRLQVNPDGSLSAADFFSPSNAPTLDLNDTDLGSGGPVALPASFGTSQNPHLLVQQGKDGRVFLLNRDNLGGRSQGPGGTDAVLGVTGPFQGLWGHPAVWGGDGGYVYMIGNGGPLRALKYGVTGSGLPALTAVGASASTFGYTSGSPVVTSNGTASGSAVVWAEKSTGPTGAGGLLLAYNPIPDANGVLQQLYSAPIGNVSKFAVPATDSGRVYVGTRDGVLMAFGQPSQAALTGSPLNLGSVPVSSTGTGTVTLTATRTVTVSAVSAAAPFAASLSPLPQTLTAGAQLNVPVSFTPTTPGAANGALTITTDAGPIGVGLQGYGSQPGLHASPNSLTFNSQPTGTTNTLNVQVTNTGTTTETIQSSAGPAAPFTATGLPAAGSSVAPGGSFVVSVTFAPTAAGTSTSSLSITSTSGTLTVPVSGTAVSGQGNLVFSPATVDFGSVPVGGSRTLTFAISNTGNVPVTITKAAPPTGDFSSAAPLPEGSVIGAGTTVQQTVTFTPTSATAETATYQITGNTGQGALSENLAGSGGPANSIPSPASDTWTYNGTATASGSAVQLTPASTQAAGSVFYDKAVPSAGLSATFTAQIGQGTGGDGLTFALLDATKATPSALGAGGGGLGFSGLPGVAVALQTDWNAQSNSTNFTGIVIGPGSGGDNVTYTATAAVPTPLRTGTHKVTVTASGGNLVVTVDGTQLLSTAVTLPPQVLAGFTAGTGSLTDVHTVSGVLITTTSGSKPGQPLSAAPTSVAFGSIAVGSTANQNVTLTNSGGVTETISAVTAPAAPFTASLPATQTTVAPGSSVAIPVGFAPTAAGSFGSSLSVTSTSGTVTVPLTGTGTGSGPRALPDFTSGTWNVNGKAVVSGNTATLTTDGQKFAAGDVINPQTMSPLGVHATFTESISGSASTGADGLTFALLNSTTTSTTSLGDSGSSLGVGKLSAVFVSFNTYSGNGVYAGNYVSVGTSAAGSSALTLLGTNKSIPTLRGTPHAIDIQVTSAGHMVVSIDGTQVLDVAVPSLPVSVRAAFTAGTGSLTDTHAVSNPAITYSA